MSDASSQRLAQTLRRAVRPTSNVAYRAGVVVSIQSGPPVRITVAVGGDTANPIAGVIPIHSYNATTGDFVYLFLVDDVNWLALGTTGQQAAPPPPPPAATLSATPNHARKLYPTTIAGSGFHPGSFITLVWNDASHSTVTLTADSSGAFSVVFTVPKSDPGSYTLTATDSYLPATTAQVAFTIDPEPPPPPPPPAGPSITASPNAGPAGSTFTLAGSGFTPSSPISAGWSDGFHTYASFNADSTGAFSVQRQVPSDMADGGYNLHATDNLPQTASCGFTIGNIVATPAPLTGPAFTAGYPGLHPNTNPSGVTIYVADPVGYLSPADGNTLASLLQTQVNEIAAAWGKHPATVTYSRTPPQPNAATWWLEGVAAGDPLAGSHGAEIGPGGYPVPHGRWAGSSGRADAIGPTASHECLEMFMNAMVDAQTGAAAGWWIDDRSHTGKYFAAECCDPVPHSYNTGTAGPSSSWFLANWIYPAWFTHGSSGPWDRRGELTSAFQVQSGGYQSYATNPDTGEGASLGYGPAQY